MRQALHIFKKDVRQLWFEIAIVLIVTAAFAFIGARRGFWLDDPGANRSVAWSMVQLMLPLAWWILIARVVYGEILPGERQFWITRPYRWTSLLAAKLLFIGVFVNLPLLAADVIILRAYGFAPGEEIQGLVWKQIVCTLVFLLPVAALCAITSGFFQLLSVAFVLLVGVLVWNVVIPGFTPSAATGGVLDWITLYCVFLVAALAAFMILIWQYAKRNTWANRTVAFAAGMVAMAGGWLIPWTSAFAIQSRLSQGRVDNGSMQVVFDSDRKWLARARIDGDDGRVQLELPLRITGIPAGMDAKPIGLVMAIESPDGVVWQAPGRPWMQVSSESDLVSLQAGVDGSVYRRVKDKPVKIRGILYFTLYGNRRTTRIPFQGRPVAVASLGLCSASRATRGQMYFLLCSSAFRSEPDLVSVHFVELGKDTFREVSPYIAPKRPSYSPLPADLDISPVSQYFTFATGGGELSDVVIDSLEPLGYVRREFELDGLRLGEFEVRPANLPR
jgi:hypothetical protein